MALPQLPHPVTTQEEYLAAILGQLAVVAEAMTAIAEAMTRPVVEGELVEMTGPAQIDVVQLKADLMKIKGVGSVLADQILAKLPV